ncbi:MAG: translation initiation factor eIF-1A [Candidatus Diapherotrites archaeon]|nr:translation initiation factor eIF-1A [Candidatus Diapherotrites archaeon]
MEERQNEESNLKLPKKENREIFGLLIQLHGSNQVRVLGEDGKERMCRIPGRMKKKVWLKEGDLVIIQLWETQQDRADVVWRYFGNQIEQLKRKGFLKNLPV